MSLARIGRRFGMHEATVAERLRERGLSAAYRDRHAAKGGLQRAQLEALVAAGMSIAEIARDVERSKATVRHWLREYDLKTVRAEWRAATVSLAQAPGEIVMRPCRAHGPTQFKRTSEGAYRCLLCRSEAVTRRRRKVKRVLVEEAGGACEICGYDRCVTALEFHHIVPEEKSFALSVRSARSLDSLREEARKCALLCANCHCEVELGIVALAGASSSPRPSLP